MASELSGLVFVWLNALVGTVAICASGACCVPVVALGACVYCLRTRRSIALEYAALPCEDTEERADRAMEQALRRAHVREMQCEGNGSPRE